MLYRIEQYASRSRLRIREATPRRDRAQRRTRRRALQIAAWSTPFRTRRRRAFCQEEARAHRRASGTRSRRSTFRAACDITRRAPPGSFGCAGYRSRSRDCCSNSSRLDFRLSCGAPSPAYSQYMSIETPSHPVCTKYAAIRDASCVLRSAKTSERARISHTPPSPDAK